MKTLHLEPIVPQYLKDFECLGSKCPETCCQGWKVDIDEHTFKKYQKVNNYSFAKKLQIAVIPVKNPTRSDYAVIQMEKDNKCPLLDQAGLCEVHSKLGSNYLSDTCQHYPRSFTTVNEQLRCFATMSCPGVAESALLNPNGLMLTQMNMAIPGKAEVPVANLVNFKDHPSMVVEYLEPIYEVSCMVLRQPDLTAVQGMSVLTLMMQKILRHFAEPDPMVARTELAQTLTDFCNPSYCLEVKNAMDQLPRQTSAKIYLLKGITLKYLQEHKARSSFLEMLGLATQGLKFEATDIHVSENAYGEAEKNWFSPFDNQHLHILKNYLLNDLGKNTFPAGRSLSLEAEFMSLAMRFALVRLYLIGIAGAKKESFCEKDYVQLIYTFSRNLEHSSFFADAYEAMEKQGYASLASAAILLA